MNQPTDRADGHHPRTFKARVATGIVGVVLLGALSGCAVIAVADAAVSVASAAVSVGATVVSTGVKVTGKAVGAAVDAVSGDPAKASAPAAAASAGSEVAVTPEAQAASNPGAGESTSSSQ